jgi:protein-tyrosine-phosphatase
MMKKVAFVCTHNSCRSQMAEGWAKHLGKGLIEVYSAGTENYPNIKPLAVKVMKESGIDISDQRPKLIGEIPQELDVLITMGCGVACPFIPCQHREDWALTDPSGGPIEEYRKTREIIRQNVIDLLKKIESDQL